MKKGLNVFTLKDKFAKFNELWQPKIVGELNDSHVKIAKVQGEFIWHHHEDEDELFYLLRGTLHIHLRDQEPLVLKEGDMAIIPKGVEHRPVAESEAWIMMIEPKTTTNTGNRTDSDRTVEQPEWI